jgi:probable rRNA maturation factor
VKPSRSRRHGRRLHGPDDGTVSVLVADEQDHLPVDVATWQALAEQVLAAEGVRGEAELSLLFVDAGAMAELNERFMGGSGPTDVLSFPIDAVQPDVGPVDAGPTSGGLPAGNSGDATERFVEGAVPLGADPGDPGRHPDGGPSGPHRMGTDFDDLPLLLGDVVICPEVAARNAPEHAGTVDDELALLVVHGILHVLGMDHANDGERVAMQSRERHHLATLWRLPARDPWELGEPGEGSAGVGS